MKSLTKIFSPQVQHVKLPGLSLAVIRPIRPDDGPRLSEGLRKLSLESRRQRFFYSKSKYTAAELKDFTHCDGAHHLALVLVEIGPDCREDQFIAVARSMRDKVDFNLAEVAIAVADAWQHRGVGGILIRALASSAWEAGIQSWSASFYTDNFAMRKLLELVGYEQSEKSEEIGAVSLAVYRLSPPSLVPPLLPKRMQDSEPTGRHALNSLSK